MSCPCEKKIENNTCPENTPPVIEINGGECPILFHTVVISASQGDKETIPPTYGAYRNTRVYYEADDVSFLYDSDGVPQLLSGSGGAEAVSSVNGQTGDVVLDAEDVNAAPVSDIADLQSQIDAITVSSDVKDVVGTYADLQNYDTSTLSDNDIIKVLSDETQGGKISYYRWNAASSQFSLIGSEGPYQMALTAGANISIDANNEISATDTTYSNFVGTDGTDAGTAGLVPAPAVTDAGKFLKADGTWDDIDGTTETYTITGTDWVAISGASPYTYSADVTATATIGANTICELFNDDAVTFATYGFAIGAVNSQTVTIYSVGVPTSSVTLKINYKG